MDIGQIETFNDEYGDVDLTSAGLEKLGRVNTTLSQQWGRMEAAWFDHNPADGNVGAEALVELDKIVTATRRVVGGILATSGQFIAERRARPSPELRIQACLIREGWGGLWSPQTLAN